MNFKKWLKSIQTVNNNGAHTVNGIKPPLNLAKPAKTFLFSSWNWADNFDRALWIQPILIFDPFHHKFIWIEVIPMIYQQNLHYIFARMILLYFDKTNLLKYRNLQIEFMLFDLAWNSTTYFFINITIFLYFVLHMAVNTNVSEQFVITAISSTCLEGTPADGFVLDITVNTILLF